MISWSIHQTCDPCVVVHRQCINSHSEVVYRVIEILMGHKAPFLEFYIALRPSSAVLLIIQKAICPCARQLKFVVAPIGTVWLSGLRIINASVKSNKKKQPQENIPASFVSCSNRLLIYSICKLQSHWPLNLWEKPKCRQVLTQFMQTPIRQTNDNYVGW